MATSLEDLSVDQLLSHAKTLQGSHNLLTTLMNDPATREQAQRALKKANPNLVIPEIDAADRFRESDLKPLRETVESLQAKLLERDVRDRIEKQRADTKGKYKLNDADIGEVEKLMTAKDDPIPSYDAAARVYLAGKQAAEPTPSSLMPPIYEMPEKDVWGPGIGSKANLDKIAMNEAFKALNDIRSGKVAGMGPAVQN